MELHGNTPVKALAVEIFLPAIFLPHFSLLPEGGKKMMGKNMVESQEHWKLQAAGS
jgi:hypothetical protein